jgi:hypothetical protein
MDLSWKTLGVDRHYRSRFAILSLCLLAAALIVVLAAPQEVRASSAALNVSGDASDASWQKSGGSPNVISVRDPLKPTAKPTPSPRPTSGPGSGCKLGVAKGDKCVGVRPLLTPFGPRPQPFVLPREPETQTLPWKLRFQ